MHCINGLSASFHLWKDLRSPAVTLETPGLAGLVVQTRRWASVHHNSGKQSGILLCFDLWDICLGAGIKIPTPKLSEQSSPSYLEKILVHIKGQRGRTDNLRASSLVTPYLPFIFRFFLWKLSA